ncbi:hypothetical protein [Synechocystis sp. PCC 7509]|nr:hypothetical protein [Synechocystis sp. PCC 7509]
MALLLQLAIANGLLRSGSIGVGSESNLLFKDSNFSSFCYYSLRA